MTPKERAVQTAIAAIEKAVRKSLDAVLPQVMADLFDAGGAEYAAALQRAMHEVNPLALTVHGPLAPYARKPASEDAAGTAGKDGRAARGSVRKAILRALLPAPDGLSTQEVVIRAKQIDPTISLGGINNELNRQKGHLYTHEDGHWRVPPYVSLGGDYYDLNGLRNPEKDRATEPPTA